MARATRRAKRSSPNARISSASSVSGRLATRSAALSPCAAHSHVERPVEAERETALGVVELHRGDPEIERDPGDRPALAGASSCTISPKRPSKAAGARGAARPARRRGAPPRDRGRCRRPGTGRREQRLAVAAVAKGSVDVNRAVARRQRPTTSSSRTGIWPASIVAASATRSAGAVGGAIRVRVGSCRARVMPGAVAARRRAAAASFPGGASARATRR